MVVLVLSCRVLTLFLVTNEVKRHKILEKNKLIFSILIYMYQQKMEYWENFFFRLKFLLMTPSMECLTY